MCKIIGRMALRAAALTVAVCIASCGDDGSPVNGRVDRPQDRALIDSTYLDSLVFAIDNGDYGEVHSVLIHRRDSLVFERYFNGYDRNRFDPVYSVTKSVTSALIGIAIDRGELTGVNEKMLDYFDYYPVIANLDERKEAINIQQLLTMTAGFEWDEWTLPYSHPDNDIAHMYNSSDWVKYILDLPMSHVPGAQFVYNSGVSMVLSAILTNATGMSASGYAAAHLFGRMEGTQWLWDPAPVNPGMSIGGWGIRMRPIDMVAFGRLYLNNGRWGDDQIVSAEWVEASTAPHAVITSRTEYGYQWWRYSDVIVDEGYVDVNDIFIAVGRGGQYIWVVPQFELVVVSTAWNDDNGESSSPMFFRYIIPAVRSVEGASADVLVNRSPRLIPVVGFE